MAAMKMKEIAKLSEKDRNQKLQELKFELVKAKANVSKQGNTKIKEIKKLIARILTFNNSKGGVDKA